MGSSKGVGHATGPRPCITADRREHASPGLARRPRPQAGDSDDYDYDYDVRQQAQDRRQHQQRGLGRGGPTAVQRRPAAACNAGC